MNRIVSASQRALSGVALAGSAALWIFWVGSPGPLNTFTVRPASSALPWRATSAHPLTSYFTISRPLPSSTIIVVFALVAMSASAQGSAEARYGKEHTQSSPSRRPHGSAPAQSASVVPQHVRLPPAKAVQSERGWSGDRSGRGSPAQSSGKDLNEKARTDIPRHTRNGDGREQWQWASLMKQAGYQGQPSVVRVAADGPMTDVSKQSLGVSTQCLVQGGGSRFAEQAADSLLACSHDSLFHGSWPPRKGCQCLAGWPTSFPSPRSSGFLAL